MSEYISIDFSKQGVWLDMAIDDLGSSRYWMTIEGEEVELTEKQYRVLMEQRVEAHKASTKAERERILDLLKNRLLMAVDEESGLRVFRELIPVDRTSAALVIQALIWAIENEELARQDQK